MAEIVEYRVDKTLGELNLLIEFGLLNESQAKKIVHKRQNFEYRLRRRTRTELDYLEYIKYEINMLESIDGYRRTVIKDYYKQKRNQSEEELDRRILLLQAKKLNEVVRSRSAHISSLFRKLTSSYQFNKMLWQAYIDFAISRKWNTRVTALYWRLLRIASNDQTIWIAAARHELETNSAYDSARSLYLRALRHHPISSVLWADYFKMEMRFMHTIKQRAHVVFKKVDKNDEQSSDNIWVGDDEDDEELQKDGEADTDEAVATKEDQNEKTDIVHLKNPINEDDPITLGDLPKKVYDEAVKTLGANLQEYHRFIVCIIKFLTEECQSSPGLDSVKLHVLNSIRSANSTDEERGTNDWSYCVAIKTRYEESLNDCLEKGSPNKRIKLPVSGRKTLEECYRTEGLSKTRDKFKELEKSVINRTLSLYIGMIHIEEQQLEKNKSQQQADHIRTIYEKAIGKFGNIKPKLWFKYLEFEHSIAKSLEDLVKINALYERAQRTLDPTKVQHLIEKYTLCLLHKDSATQIAHSDHSDLSDD